MSHVFYSGHFSFTTLSKENGSAVMCDLETNETSGISVIKNIHAIVYKVLILYY